MRFKAVVTVVVLTFSAVAFAGDKVGNGGDGVLCTDEGGQKRVVLYDYHEGQELRGLHIDQKLAGLPFEAAMEGLLSRLERLNPTRAAKFRQWFSTFFAEARSTKDELIDIPDAGVGSIPEDCRLVQIAVQQEPSLPGDFRYVINQRYWALMDGINRAGLVMHELILRELSNQLPDRADPRTSAPLVHRDTKYVRYLNSQIATSAFAEIDVNEYLHMLINAHVLSGDSAQGLPIYLDSVLLKADPGFYDSWIKGPTFDARGRLQMAQPYCDDRLGPAPARSIRYHALSLSVRWPSNQSCTNSFTEGGFLPNGFARQVTALITIGEVAFRLRDYDVIAQPFDSRYPPSKLYEQLVSVFGDEMQVSGFNVVQFELVNRATGERKVRRNLTIDLKTLALTDAE